MSSVSHAPQRFQPVDEVSSRLSGSIVEIEEEMEENAKPRGRRVKTRFLNFKPPSAG